MTRGEIEGEWEDLLKKGDAHEASHVYLADGTDRLALDKSRGLMFDRDAEQTEDGEFVKASSLGQLCGAAVCSMMRRFDEEFNNLPIPAEVMDAMTGEDLSEEVFIKVIDHKVLDALMKHYLTMGVRLGMAQARGKLDDWHEVYSGINVEDKPGFRAFVHALNEIEDEPEEPKGEDTDEEPDS